MSDLAPEPCEDPAVVRAEERLAFLRQLTEIGMELARGLRERASEPADPKAGKSPAELFGPLSRAVRLTIALEEKTDQALADLKAGVARSWAIVRAAQEKRSYLDLDDLPALERFNVGRLVVDAAKVEIDDEDAMETLCEALHERLQEDEAYESVTDRPLREIVEQLCKDLCLAPDWSQWSGEGWAPGYIPPRARFSPFNRPSRTPILNTHDQPIAAAGHRLE